MSEIEYIATRTIYIQGIGEIREGRSFRAPAEWVDVLRYVARPASSAGAGLGMGGLGGDGGAGGGGTSRRPSSSRGGKA